VTVDSQVAVVSRWLRRDGDFVRADEPLCMIDADGVDVEVPAPATGRLHHLAREGDRVTATSQIARIEPEPFQA